MLELGTVLVVDDSRLLREILGKLLATYARRVETAGSCAEARERLTSDAWDLHLIDVVLPDGDGHELLEEIVKRDPEAAVVMMSARWTPEGAERARAAGARGFVAKPVSMDALARTLGRVDERRAHARVPVHAAVHLLDGGDAAERLLVWYARDLSPEGAFVETRGALPCGSLLELEIGDCETRARLRARVVRVQEPSWLHPGGVGVRFEEVDDAARRALEALLARASRES